MPKHAKVVEQGFKYVKFANLTLEMCLDVLCAYVDNNNDVDYLVNTRLKWKLNRADQPRFVF